MKPSIPIPVGLLGATGMVGQRFALQLDDHPWFRVAWLGASERSVGRPYSEAARWVQDRPMPEGVAGMTVRAAEVSADCPEVVFSAMDASVAGEIELAFARAGRFVLSNSRNHRLAADVPLVIPEVNPDHIELIAHQRRARGWSGAIVTNPNCSAITLAMALAPLRPFGIRRVLATTLQAVSGAGYPGVPAVDMLGNAVPFIGGEEDKLAVETPQAVRGAGGGEGGAGDGRGERALQPGSHGGRAPGVRVGGARVATLAGRGARRDGGLSRAAPETGPAERAAAAGGGGPGRGPSPAATRRDGGPRDDGHGGARARVPGHGAGKFAALGHNTIRGAAGASVLNAELLMAGGWLGRAGTPGRPGVGAHAG